MGRKRTLRPDSVHSRPSLELWLEADLGVSRRHAGRIWQGGLAHPDLPRAVRERFHERFALSTSEVVDEREGAHGRKLVVKLQDGELVETVIIKHPNRTTVCVSSQAGCRMGCTFCATGLMGKRADLRAAEIVEQVVHARERDPSVSGVVFMGMGEPLDSATEVLEAIRAMSDPRALGGRPIPLRKITLSTVGVVPGLKRLAREFPQVQLALSLHAPDDEVRRRIVPTATAFPVRKIMDAVAEYQRAGRKSVMIEYIMIEGVNASDDCARRLGELLAGMKCVVNLIPYNPTEAGERFGFAAPSDEVCERFAKILYGYPNDKGKPLRCSIRYSSQRGQDIDAACGQLALKNLDEALGSGCDGDGKGRTNGVGDIEDVVTGGTSGNGIGKKKIRSATAARSAQGKDKGTAAVSASCNAEGEGGDGRTSLGGYRRNVLLLGAAAVGGLAILLWNRRKR